jgi:hypothetical protein
MTESFHPSNRYAPREVHTLGIERTGGWCIKRYAITVAGAALDRDRFADPTAMAHAELPIPAIGAHRPGLGFTIAHQGAGADYLVLCWWDRDNELPIRIWVSAPGREGGRWSPARGAESVCVWDLGIVWFERQAFVRTMIGPSPPDARGYLDAVCGTPV